jgi:nitroimidazol reductase NimA-like FMN-containing flavoprotein (pyridoxamine 5'-phosphate oxidase superfamily)
MNPKNETSIKKAVQRLFAKQRLACLATSRSERPHTSLVAFAATADLRTILFATTKSSRKYDYLKANHRVSMLVDDRTDRITDFKEGTAVTVIGRAKELDAHGKNAHLKLYVEQHPHLKEFAESEQSSLFGVEVETYRVVTRFQQVDELHMKSGSGH